MPLIARLRRAVVPHSRAQLLIALTVLLAVAFGGAAWQERRAQHLRTRSTVCYFAVIGARELLAQAHVLLQITAAPIFAAVGGSAPRSRGTRLPPPSALARTAQALHDCHCTLPLPAHAYFRIDLPGGPIIADPPAGLGAAVDTTGIRKTVTRNLDLIPDAGVAALPVTASGEPRDTLRSVIVVSPQFALDGTVRAVYGFVMDPSAFVTSLVAPIFEQVPLFPRDLTTGGKIPNAALVSYRVADYEGVPIQQSPAQFRGCTGTATPDRTMAVVRISLSATTATTERWLAVSDAQPRLPLLAALLLATIGCGVAAGVVSRREAQLAALRSDFVTGVSHEFRMPLAQILLFGETLSLGRARSETERGEAADIIVREANRLTGLVENVLYFSRVEHHNLHVAPQPVPLASFVEGVIAAVRPLAAGADASLAVDVPEGLNAVLDPTAFRQVLFNLLDNALKYGPRGQRVSVGAAAADPTHVRLWVDDEGPGIPAAESTTIFEPFVRLERDRHTAVGGSGLGLTVVRDIVSLHHGRVWVEAGPRGGTRFVIELPRADS